MMDMAVREGGRKNKKIGNSSGGTFPPEVLEHLNVKQGEMVVFDLEKDGKVVLKKRPAVNVEGFEEIDADFLEGMKDLFDRYDNTLRNLADR
ncbi:AbrB/MazE/SpoVT family DNA-binding domain-containing protein [Priestia megaterium]|uniref:AbrB/MazE/SpoVT family DNA-binding domain-containing protein n=1 Tax=Priestia megaterium TaxID=1404 RepID=UPI00064CD7F8|nr:hypothetical protein [Priestia megaterium]KLV29020.1 hypothetical protein ABW04_26590 [Priestia megaterium]